MLELIDRAARVSWSARAAAAGPRKVMDSRTISVTSPAASPWTTRRLGSARNTIP